MEITRREFNRAVSRGMALGATASAFHFLGAPLGFAEDVLESAAVRKIHQYIADHQPQHIARIQEFLRLPSISSWGWGTQVNGRENMAECADALLGLFKHMGCQWAELVKTDGLAGAAAGYDCGAKKTVSHYFMYDTQPFDEKEWSSPPLAANVVDRPPFGKSILARGAINSKGPLVAFLNACEAIIAVEGKLPVNILFTCDGEEEQGSPHFHQVLEPYTERLKKCSAHLDAGPSQNSQGQVNMSLGNKGIAYFELHAHGAKWGRGPQKIPIHSSRKAILDSPTWRLIEALRTMFDPGSNRILIPNYYDAIVPPNEEEEMLIATLIQKIGGRALASDKENSKVWMNNWSDAEAIRHLTFDTSLNIDGIWSGYTGPGTATILPEKAACKIDSRLVPDQEIDTQIALVRQHLDKQGFTDIELKKMGGGDEWARTSVKAAPVQAALAVYKHYGIEPAIWPRSAGSSPQAQYTRPPLNLPAASAGMGHGGRAHSIDEYFVIEGNAQVAGLARCEQSIVDLLYTYANWPE
ncbi:MAG TPA: M20/M25/M40 family metallo-hydrolase [Terriglobales bacterium]|nr:M20/M25/M40 family metallo-hydrolase [Terriglobales bacterium]